MASLVPCPRCASHAKVTEIACPSCGEPMRREDGSVPRTAIAVLLGLTTAGAIATGCGSSTGVQVFYGPSPTTTSSGAGGAGGAGGGASSASATSSSSGGGEGAGTGILYGPAQTTGSSGSSSSGSDGG